MPGSASQKPKPALLDPEALTIVRADATAQHASVKLSGPQPTGPKFPQEKLAQLYTEVGKYGFEQFTVLPVGAQLASLPARQAVVALDRTILTEQFSLSGSTLRPFGELATELFTRVQSVLDVEGYAQMQLKLVAFWPLRGTDAITFIAKALPVREAARTSLGPEFDVAGVRFHKGKAGQTEEWDVKIEPLLQQPDRLWIELVFISTRPFREGSLIAANFEAMERFLRNNVMSSVLAMAGNARTGRR